MDAFQFGFIACQIKSMEQEIKDLSGEFQNERTDYLEMIRKQEQQIKLLQSIVEKVRGLIFPVSQ